MLKTIFKTLFTFIFLLANCPGFGGAFVNTHASTERLCLTHQALLPVYGQTMSAAPLRKQRVQEEIYKLPVQREKCSLSEGFFLQ